MKKLPCLVYHESRFLSKKQVNIPISREVAKKNSKNKNIDLEYWDFFKSCFRINEVKPRDLRSVVFYLNVLDQEIYIDQSGYGFLNGLPGCFDVYRCISHQKTQGQFSEIFAIDPIANIKIINEKRIKLYITDENGFKLSNLSDEYVIEVKNWFSDIYIINNNEKIYVDILKNRSYNHKNYHIKSNYEWIYPFYKNKKESFSKERLNIVIKLGL